MVAQRLRAVLLGAATSAVAVKFSIESAHNKFSDPWDSFVSYSIEFASFPDFAGNLSCPNRFSNNLLNNIANITGDKPIIRVGGNTQDYAIYNASLSTALLGIVDPARSPDYPTTVWIGPSYFESYYTWPGCRYSHGFNLALGANGSTKWQPQGWDTLRETVPLACKALGGGKLYTWEYGNEPDLYAISNQGPVRPPSWNATTYISQWLNGTKEIKKEVHKLCPELRKPRFMGLSFTLPDVLNMGEVWAEGIDREHDIEYYSAHNYITGANSPGVTLQDTLMNHSRTIGSVKYKYEPYANISSQYAKVPPLIWGEANSLSNQGRAGLSNTFGAALWGIDFNLYSASLGFKRVHMHQGTNFRYQSWQPIDTNNTVKGTKAPYYGNIAVANMIGNRYLDSPVSISNIPLASVEEAAYAAHYQKASDHGSSLARIMIINMRGYNTTVDGKGIDPLKNPRKRNSQAYTFDVRGVREGAKVTIERLMANGSDAITGVTFDGWSYNYELDEGRPVRLHNVTVGESLVVRHGEVTVHVSDSSAALLRFE